MFVYIHKYVYIYIYIIVIYIVSTSYPVGKTGYETRTGCKGSGFEHHVLRVKVECCLSWEPPQHFVGKWWIGFYLGKCPESLSLNL